MRKYSYASVLTVYAAVHVAVQLAGLRGRLALTPFSVLQLAAMPVVGLLPLANANNAVHAIHLLKLFAFTLPVGNPLLLRYTTADSGYSTRNALPPLRSSTHAAKVCVRRIVRELAVCPIRKV